MDCFEEAKKELKDTIFESRIDSAFFSEKIGSIRVSQRFSARKY
jgi:hypothetical protein